MKPERWRQLESLYNQAHEMNEDQRSSFLREACSGDKVLQQELEELIAEETHAASFLEKAALQEIAHEFAAAEAPSWIGRQIGNYQFLSLLGAGGMGEVYRAHDIKLKRDVAVKLLPDEFSSNPERISRFQREAQLLASLNHPNIAAIYGLEEANGILLLILELVEGETLADRIQRGPIPMEDALKMALQIAEALEAAHEKSVTHRDLKPANIKVTVDGKVKVLDFGLAKTLLGDAGVNLSNSPTLSMAATQQGVILGTAAYMSPEQARGQPVDKRADIWAFGVVLYEMLTGRQTFSGEGVADILSSVLKSDPDWDSLPVDTPAAIRRLLRRCLRKDRKRRLQTAGDARIEIEEAGTESEIAEPGAATTKPQRREILAWIAAGAGLTAAAGALGVSYLRKPADVPDVRNINTPPTPDPMSFALSPDGRNLVFVAGDNEPQLWLQPVGSLAQKALAGTEGATSPFWKPDSQSIAFFAAGKLKRIDIDFGGRVGSPQTLATMPILLSRGGAWGRDGFILFPRDAVSPLSRVPDSPGGKLEEVTRLHKNHSRHSFPCFLPGGRQFLCYVPGADVGGIYIGSLDSTEIQQVIGPGVSNGVYWAPSWLLFVREKALLAQQFDPTSGKVIGATVQIASPVADEGGLGAFSVSATGRVVAYRAPAEGGRQLKWFDPKGNSLGAFGQQDNNDMRSPAISPNGQRVAVGSNKGTRILDPTSQPFPSGGSPIWSPNGRWIAYYSSRESGFGLYVKPVIDKVEETQIVGPPEFKAPCDWHMNSLLYFKIDAKTGLRSLWVQRVAEDGKPVGESKPLINLNPNWDEFNGRFSPNGLLVAYQSNESKTLEIKVVPILRNVRPVQVSLDGGIWPRWSPDGEELYYLRLDGMLMAVAINFSGAEVSRGVPRELWRPRIVGFNVDLHTGYDVALAGVRRGQFLISEPVKDAVTLPITLVQNWNPPVK